MSIYQFFPELDFWFKDYWNSRGEITVSQINLPVVVNEEYVCTGSIFELLFNIGFDHTTSMFGFGEVSYTTFPPRIKDRLSIKANRPTCYMSDSTGDNIKEITDEEIDMMILLLDYRDDLDVDISDLVYDNLESRLSKLVYIYLDVMVNDEYSSIDRIPLLDDSTRTIDLMFEIFTCNECHKKLKLDTVIVDSSTVRLKPVRKVVEIGSDTTTYNSFTIDDPLPYSLDNIYIYYNGRVLDSTLYTLEFDPVVDPTDVVVSWDDGDIEGLELAHTFVVDYYTSEDYSLETNIVSEVIDEEYLIHDYEEDT